MKREDKFSDIQKRMIKDEGSQLSGYIQVRVYTIKDSIKTEDRYLCMCRRRAKTKSREKWFFENEGMHGPGKKIYFLDDPELKIEEKEGHYILNLEQNNE